MNRLDKVVVFRPLGDGELKRIVDIELSMVQQRIFNATPDRAFIFRVTDTAKACLLREGTDMRYGARHLKRAIERLLVQPMSNLIASDQVGAGDWIRVDFNRDSGRLVFAKDAEGLPIRTMVELLDASQNIVQPTSKHAGLFVMPRAQTLVSPGRNPAA